MIRVRANTIDERELVEKCMQEVCRKLNFSGTQNLLQRDIEFLCDSIESKTGIQISLSTMKRLLNGQFSKLPQPATLHAITTFLDYQHWQDFKAKHTPPIVNGAIHSETESVVDTKSPSPAGISSPNFFRKKNLIIAGLVVLVVTGSLALSRYFMGAKEPAGFDRAEFSVTKTTSNDIPNTVVFNYNIDDVVADSFFIQQSWDRNRRVQIYKNNYTLTDIYYEPGYHTAKLYANDQIIKTEDVSIPTDSWFLFSKTDMYAKPEYIRSASLIEHGVMAIELDDFIDNAIDISHEREYGLLYFPTKMDVSSDNYVFKARVRMKEIRNNACPHIMIEIFCQRYFNFSEQHLKVAQVNPTCSSVRILLADKTRIFLPLVMT